MKKILIIILLFNNKLICLEFLPQTQDTIKNNIKKDYEKIKNLSSQASSFISNKYQDYKNNLSDWWQKTSAIKKLIAIGIPLAIAIQIVADIAAIEDTSNEERIKKFKEYNFITRPWAMLLNK